MSHEDIPYYHSGIKELDEETYELLKRFALTYGESKPLTLYSRAMFSRDSDTKSIIVDGYTAAWEYPELAISYAVNFIDSPANERVHGQIDLLVTELIGDEERVILHIYSPFTARNSDTVGYQAIQYERPQAEIDEEKAWHAEIDSHRPPRKPGELRAYLGKETTDDIAREKELRLHLLKESEIHLQASKL